MVVTYGLIGIEPPRASMMPPTIDVTANTTLSTGTSTGDDEMRQRFQAQAKLRDVETRFDMQFDRALAAFKNRRPFKPGVARGSEINLVTIISGEPDRWHDGLHREGILQGS